MRCEVSALVITVILAGCGSSEDDLAFLDDLENKASQREQQITAQQEEISKAEQEVAQEIEQNAQNLAASQESEEIVVESTQSSEILTNRETLAPDVPITQQLQLNVEEFSSDMRMQTALLEEVQSSLTAELKLVKAENKLLANEITSMKQKYALLQSDTDSVRQAIADVAAGTSHAPHEILPPPVEEIYDADDLLLVNLAQIESDIRLLTTLADTYAIAMESAGAAMPKLEELADAYPVLQERVSEIKSEVKAFNPLGRAPITQTGKPPEPTVLLNWVAEDVAGVSVNGTNYRVYQNKELKTPHGLLVINSINWVDGVVGISLGNRSLEFSTD